MFQCRRNGHVAHQQPATDPLQTCIFTTTSRLRMRATLPVTKISACQYRQSLATRGAQGWFVMRKTIKSKQICTWRTHQPLHPQSGHRHARHHHCPRTMLSSERTVPSLSEAVKITRFNNAADIGHEAASVIDCLRTHRGYR